MLAEPKGLSVFYPAPPRDLDGMAAFASFVRRLGSGRLWLGQSFHLESQMALAALAARQPGLPLGTAVSLAPLRHPYQAAVEARTVSVLSKAPYVAGYGPGSLDLQERLLPEPYHSPLTAMADYATVMRRLLDGDAVEHRGAAHTTRYALPELPSPRVEVGLGVLRPGMARTAGSCADVAITWLAPLPYLTDRIMPALRAGARAADRPVPRVASVVHLAVRRPGRDLDQVAFAAVGAHLGSAHYADMLRRAGLDVDPGRPREAAGRLVGDGVHLSGDPKDIAARLHEYRAAGVDEVILNVTGVFLAEGARAALEDLHAVTTAFQS
ncbi:LLM class flavin-dependent oxidoreductase [Streptomyces sp. Ru62]|uniref:LLM class flavin-dependent oxidoreductase n=1 Tax=Streptomyces sp. Ru62 TaxID=2080745 RepID=UPI000CDDD303|nr:LLM class flavin-dependent oxidoreductase [Streptomyces sp. Ru62]POX63423.1 LLM class flavin-dependent oxidoreductase [Streptomyces sp. Ru62]